MIVTKTQTRDADKDVHSITSPDLSRFKRRQTRKESEAATSLLLLHEPLDISGLFEEFPVESGIETQTDITGELIVSMTSELQNLRTENIHLSSKVENTCEKYDQIDFEGKDEKVLYFTGLQTYQKG